MKQISRRICSVLLVLSMLLTLCGAAFAGQPEFPDTAGHWAETTINALAKDGVVSGFDDGLCHPDETVNGEQFVTLVVRYFAYPLDESGTLWPDAYLAAAEKAGIIDSAADGTGQISRMEMIRIMLRALNRAKNTGVANTLFTDDAEILPTDKADINKAVELDILHGYPDGTVRAYSHATRAEAFVMLRRMMDVHEEDVRKAAEKKNQNWGYAPTPAPTPTPEPTPTPVPVERSISFTLPVVAHTDTAIVVDTVLVNTDGAEVQWKIQRDGQEVTIADAVNGTLEDSGGTVQFKEAGTYVVTASFTQGEEYHCTQTIRVYPVVSLELELPSVIHTDELATLVLRTENLNDLPVTWTGTKDGVEIDPSTVISGAFTDGEPLSFPQAGTYTLTAAVTDELGRNYTATESITVYPVGAVGFFLPTVFHTDDTVWVEASSSELNGSAVTWSLTRNGAPVRLTDYINGALTNSGGEIQVREKGSYVLTASFTDDADRAYSYEQAFTVYPIPTVTFGIPEAAWTDTKIPVTVESTDTEAVTVEWLVDNTYGYQDWNTFVDGTLNNDGGTIRFKRAGQYELVARITDATGRVFLYEVGAECEVQPVLRISVTVPKLFRVDKVVDIRTSGNNNALPVVWSLTKDGEAAELSECFTGTLNNYGGRGNFVTHGDYVLTASMTDVLGRTFSVSEDIKVYSIATYAVTVPETCHIGTSFTVTGEGEYLDDCVITWSMTEGDAPAEYVGTLGDDGGEISIRKTGSYTLTATIADPYGNVYTAEDSIEITNTAPDVPTITVDLDYFDTLNTYTPDCQVKANIIVESNDADGDGVGIEYAVDSVQTGYLGVGSYTVKVRAIDQWGLASEWVENSFTISASEPDVDLFSDLLGSNDGTNVEGVDFNLEISRPGPNQIFVADYHNPNHLDEISRMEVSEDGSTINGWFAFGRHILLVKVIDVFGNTAYGARPFIVSNEENQDKTSISSLSTTITEEGLYNGTDLLAYVGGFTFKVPAISGHNSSYQDVVEIFGVTEDGTQEPVLSFNTNNGYAYVHSGGIYEYTMTRATVVTEEWSGWEKQKYTKMIFHYEMPSNHESCVANATEGLSYRVRYSFIPEQIDEIERLFNRFE